MHDPEARRVNLASRLEGATKDLGVDVLIEARPVKQTTVQGRARPVMTFEVIGLASGESGRAC